MRPVSSLPADFPDEVGWFYIFKKICALAVPISFQWLIGMGQWLVPFFFLGHVSSAALGGYALGNMFCNFTGNAITIGFLSNMSSLNSQAFGAKNAELYALYTQRNVCICTIGSFVIGLIWYSVPSYLLLSLGVEEDARTFAIRFCRYMIISLWPSYMYELQKEYLQNQKLVYFPSFIQIPMVALNAGVNYFYIHRIGFDAAAIGLVSSNIFGCLALFIYICCAKLNLPSYSELFCSKSPFVGWGEIFRLGVPGALMMMMDWGCFEVNTAFAGRLGDETLAAHSLLVQVVSVSYMIPLGISTATQIVIGQKLGEGNYQNARKASVIGVFSCALCSSFAMLILYVLRKQYFHLVTSSVDAIDIASKTMVYAIVFEVFDGICNGLQGVFKGIGKQNIAWKYMLGQPFIGLPTGYYLCFQFKFGLVGIWLGMIIAVLIVSSCLVFLWYCVDWEHEQKLIADRVKVDENVCADADIQARQNCLNRVNRVSHHSIAGDEVDYLLL